MFLVKRRAGIGGLEHELVIIGIVGDGVRYYPVHVLGPVLFEADDGRTKNADTMILQGLHELAGIDAV